MRQVNEKTTRLRYIRVLEKFSTKAVTLLKYENFDLDLYKKSMIKAFENLQKTKSVPLYSEYPAKLQQYAQVIVDTLDNHSQDFETEKAKLLKEYNILQKEKNKNSYKKDKHKHKKFYDGF